MKKIVISLAIAVVAAAIAVCSPVRSMLGADGIEITDGDSGPTCRDYVQDGLIAMYDAIENAGWGRHSAISYPVNLVTGIYEFQWGRFASAEITPNALIVEGDATVVSSPLYDFGSESPYATVEWNVALMREDNSSNVLNLWMEFGANVATAASLNLWLQNSQLRMARGNFYFAYGENVESGELRSGVFSIASSVDASSDADYNLARYYVDGEFIKETARNNWVFSTYYVQNPARMLIRVGNGTLAIVRNIRLYNRALTDEEILHNYEIDRERFGLL